MLSNLHDIWKGDGDGMDTRGRDVSCGGCDDVVPAGRDDDYVGSSLAEEVAPITTELRELLADVNWVEITDHMRLDHGAILDGDWLDSWHAAVGHACDAIDSVHAQLERDYKVACEVNERQDEQYADMVHRLDRAYEKSRNQRKQLTEVQGALHRRNEGELKTRWQKEIDRLERENEELQRQLESLMFDNKPMTDENMAEHGWVRLPVDADGVPIHIGDVMEWTTSHLGIPEVFEVQRIIMDPSGWHLVAYPATYAPEECCHHHTQTVEDVLREFAQEMNENLGMYTGEAIDADEWRDADAKTVAKFAAKLRLAEEVDG